VICVGAGGPLTSRPAREFSGRGGMIPSRHVTVEYAIAGWPIFGAKGPRSCRKHGVRGGTKRGPSTSSAAADFAQGDPPGAASRLRAEGFGAATFQRPV
jgi:hypothetical protein